MPTITHLHRAAAVAAQERDRNAIASIALKAAQPVLNAMQRVPVKAWLERRGKVADLKAALEHHLLSFQPVLRDSMLTAYLRGRYRSALTLQQHLGHKTNLSLGRYDDAIEHLLKMLMLTDDDIEPAALRYDYQATKILKGASDELEAKLKSAVTDIVTSGVHVKGGVAAVKQAFDDAGLSPDNSFTCELIVRDEIQKAYRGGAREADQSPEMREYLWGYAWASVGDARVRPSHEAMDGAQAPLDHPVWDIWYPEGGFTGYGCRCQALHLYTDENPETILPSPLPDPLENDYP